MDTLSLPRHVAIIMDGNGRWAQRRGRERFYGHVRGAARVKEVVEAASEAGIEAVTLFAFSTENWSRPERELGVLWKLLEHYLKKELQTLQKNNIRLKAVGEIDRLPAAHRELVKKSIKLLENNTGLLLTFALSYGSRSEIVDAARRLAASCVQGEVEISAVDEKLFESYLWTHSADGLSDVDLVIRTSGEYRISNFLLWQSAYAEYYFTNTCWPDFGPDEFQHALKIYASRERRFGGVREKWDPKAKLQANPNPRLPALQV